MDLALAAAGWLILAVISVVAAACAGRAGHQEDLHRRYDQDVRSVPDACPPSLPPRA